MQTNPDDDTVTLPWRTFLTVWIFALIGAGASLMALGVLVGTVVKTLLGLG